ncbi:ATP-binding protein [Lentzea sp. NPDC006480]|uniref:ATP-binding protein n=1 Tax=Lentzea sp. NPDC006480 TaxID=3157176 RepID=UPI0033A7ECE6
MKKGWRLCLIGDSGTRRTQLLTVLGTEAIVLGLRVRYTSANLVKQLVEAADEILLMTITRYETAWTRGE